jgi:hypothetical protein
MIPESKSFVATHALGFVISNKFGKQSEDTETELE